ncbi:MAG TPA: complex I NDUFA9 subunit family protein [Alphaproteobacteria bacterium]|nr:complex I NDUFA9 subunit family protein [Alphaproteobacteria bacterium]
MSSSQIYTVLGGTGFLGSRIVRHLCAGGHRVRVAARDPWRKPELLQSDRVEPVRADLFDPLTLSTALRDTHGAVNATSLYLERGSLTFDAFHVEGAERLARIARETGTSRFVQVSGIGSDQNADDRYIRARGKGETAVRKAFPAATIVRPSVMFGPDDAFLTAILTTARRFPVYPLFGSGETRLQPVHVDDVARAIAQALQTEQPAAACYEFAGPDILSYRELVNAVTEAAGLRVRCIAVPFSIWRLLAFVTERMPGAPLTRSQVALIERDNVAADALPGICDLGLSRQSITDFVRKKHQIDGSET